ncbi:MAG: hypothetical protein M3O15_14800 [Acidobacteriota bacterium]|nr:hypothetical protein [Acidobacteriota bacterium]
MRRGRPTRRRRPRLPGRRTSGWTHVFGGGRIYANDWRKYRCGWCPRGGERSGSR